MKAFFRLLSVFGFVVFSLFLLSASQAGQIFVDDDLPSCVNGPGQADPYGVVYCKIEDAVMDAEAGDAITIAAGIYQPVSTIALNKQGLVIEGPQKNIDPRPYAYEPDLRIPGSANEAIIDGSGNLSEIFIVAENDIVINGLEIFHGLGDLIKQDSVYMGTIISYCIVHHSAGDEGIQLKSCLNCMVEYNHVYSTVGDGMSYASSSGSVMQNNEIHDVHSEHGGIYIYESIDIEILNNIIYFVSHATKGHGIRYGRGGYGNQTGTISGNIIHDVTAAGISFEDSFGNEAENIEFTNNEVYDVSQGSRSWPGIIVEDGTTYLSIIENRIHDCPLGVEVVDCCPAPDSSRIYVQLNDIYNNTTGIINSGSGLLIAENNWWGDVTGPMDSVGTNEVPECTDDPINEMNMDGAGNATGDNVDYCPWLIEPATPCHHDGDVDNNGILSPNDALLAFKFFLGMLDPTIEESCSADCNNNMQITPEDAQCIFQNFLGGLCSCDETIPEFSSRAPVSSDASIDQISSKRIQGELVFSLSSGKTNDERVLTLSLMNASIPIDAFGFSMEFPSEKIQFLESRAGKSLSGWNTFNTMSSKNTLISGAYNAYSSLCGRASHVIAEYRFRMIEKISNSDLIKNLRVTSRMDDFEFMSIRCDMTGQTELSLRSPF